MAKADSTGTAGKSLVFQLLEHHCKERGFSLTEGDPYGNAGLVENPAGKRWYFVGTRFDINPLGSAEIARDKAYAARFLELNGLAVPATRLVFVSDLSGKTPLPKTVLEFARKHGYPLFVKPNAGQEGLDVVRVETREALQDALHDIAQRHAQILVQEEIRGRDIRIVVLDGEALCTIERRPPHVTGDGMHSIAELVGKAGPVNADDSRVAALLASQGMGQDSVPSAGQVVPLLPVSNLSSGGSAQIVTDRVSSDLLELACRSASTLGLRYAGVDLIVPEDPKSGTSAYVLEVNAAPGLSNLFRQGPREAELVRQVYAGLFDKMFSD